MEIGGDKSPVVNRAVKKVPSLKEGRREGMKERRQRGGGGVRVRDGKEQ